jgi:hypothetical protein
LTDPDPPSGPAPDVDELARLRAEVQVLHERLDTRARRAAWTTTVRRALAAVAVVVAAFAAVSTLVGVWTARTTFNTDRWVQTVAPLPDDPKVTAAMSQYATSQLFAALDVEDRLKEALPPRAAFAAGPVAGQLQTYVRQAVDGVLHSDRFQAVWLELNRQAHAQLVAILRARSDVVAAGQDRVTIDLLPLINQVLRELESSLPTLFGHRLDLPDLDSGAIPTNLRLLVQSALGISLPANFAQFTVYDAGRLRALQDSVVQLKRSLIALIALTVVALGAALWLSTDRRRTVLQLGVWLIVAVLTMTVVLRAVRRDVLAQLPAGTYRDGASAAFTTVFAGLRERGWQLLWLGALLAVVGYLVGPGRLPVLLRRSLRRAARHIADGTHRLRHSGGGRRVAGWTGRHIDVLRIAGVAVAALVTIWLSTWDALAVVVVVLLLYQIGLAIVARAARPSGVPR